MEVGGFECHKKLIVNGWYTVHKHVDKPRLAGTRRLMILLISPPTHQKNVHQLIMLSLNIYYKTSYHPLPSWDKF